MPTPSPFPAPAHHAQGPLSARPAVLLVDDDPGVLGMLWVALPGLGFEPLPAGSGEEAVAVLRGRPDTSAAVLDVRMPGMDGVQTLRALRQLAPDLPCLFMTGDPGDHGTGTEGVLRKPFRLSDLAEALRRLAG